MPSGFGVTEQYPTAMDKTVTFEWDPPQGTGPDVIVDFYWIFISPRSRSHPLANIAFSSPWNVTLDYNIVYSANITAVNCAGESETFVLPDSEFG